MSDDNIYRHQDERDPDVDMTTPLEAENGHDDLPVDDDISGIIDAVEDQSSDTNFDEDVDKTFDTVDDRVEDVDPAPRDDTPTHGAWWNEERVTSDYSYNPYETGDIDAPDMETSFPTYDPTQEDYSPDVLFEDHTLEDDGGWTPLQKILLSIISVLSALLLIWMLWWALDGKDKGIIVPWQSSTSSSASVNGKNDGSSFDADSVLQSHRSSSSVSSSSPRSSSSSTVSSTTSDTDTSSDKNDVAKNDKKADDLKRENERLRQDNVSLRAKAKGHGGASTVTSTTTVNNSRPAETVYRTRTITPPPREVRVTAPPVTVTPPSVTVTVPTTVHDTITVRSTVERWVQ